MVMDCLRNAKRFHATVSFIADTGLKDATDNGACSCPSHDAVSAVRQLSPPVDQSTSIISS